ncbi:phosphate transport system permease protein [Kitasatospora sp. MAP12-15]|uniref:phosphate ABC transporter permease subunit PstC n=1 Tax=unclassified Kitasatospora TaxID=2633591 RepID=UPI002475F7D3|nr:phosphate ABC transporter permease subunit PstC [Kitasatospora sp. MAP12-44]MDH6112198.1 phosphate transport system permease protein [Kitasatospora sp. MAP12-44]
MTSPTPDSSRGRTTASRKGSLQGNSRRGDRLFFGLSAGSGILLLVIMAAIAGFLLYRSGIALSHDKTNFFTTFEWDPDNILKPSFGIAVLAFGTIVSGAIAMVLAVPLAIAIALFISHYAPRRIAQPFAYLVDLLAAVPSIVYGLWGALYLVPHLAGLTSWLNTYLGWTYIFRTTHTGAPARNLFSTGILLAIMILPIITAVTREVFRQVPRMHEEAALALGATRWEMIRTAVIPFGRPGIISASMLGLGRALGETMAVALVLSSSSVLSLHILDAGGGTFAQNIALKYAEAGSNGKDALMASGLVLFVITLLVNGGARLIIARRKEYSGANA